MARPTKYTDAVGFKIVESTRAGLHLTFAAPLAGVSVRTVYNWLAKGEAEEPPDEDAPLVAFAELYRSALAEYVRDELKSIANEHGEGKGDWKRTAWKLAKRCPREFGDKIDLTTDGEALPGGSAAVVMYLPAEVADDADDPRG